MKRRLQLGLLLGLSLAAFLLFLDGPDIVVSHEARVALPAREMAEAGWPWAAKPVPVQPVVLFVRSSVMRLAPDWSAEPVMVNPWLVPVLTGQVRLQKPPLPYWCAAVVFRLFGGFSEVTVRFVPGLLGALAVLLVYDLGRLLYGRKIGWLAALAWISTYSIAEEYRKAMADPYLAFFTLGCVWTWVRASRVKAFHDSRGRKPRIPGARSGASALGYWEEVFVFAFYLSFAFALLAKGPPAFVDILVPLLAFHVCCRARFPGRLWVHAAGVLLMLAVALPWPLYVWRHVPHAIELWRYESVGEMADNTENARPWHFYLPQLLFLALPWTAPGVVGIARQGVRAFRRYGAWVRRARA